MRKKIILTISLFLLLPPVPAIAAGGGDVSRRESAAPVITRAADRPIKDKWAVVVGISNFANPALNLHYASKDARDFYSYLVNDAGFAKDHVLMLLDEQATRANVLSAIGGKWLPHCVVPDDLVLIYVSTHGSSPDAKIDGVNYIVAHDSDPDDIYATGIAMQDLTRIVKGKVNSDRVVMLLDACHSGSVAPAGKGLVRAGNLNADAILQGCGQIVISSSEPDQTSWESKSYENSVFTRRLIEGLKCKGKNTTITDAFNYMKDLTEAEVTRDRGVLQTPVMKSKWEGKELLVASAPAQPRTGLLASIGQPASAKRVEAGVTSALPTEAAASSSSSSSSSLAITTSGSSASGLDSTGRPQSVSVASTFPNQTFAAVAVVDRAEALKQYPRYLKCVSELHDLEDSAKSSNADASRKYDAAKASGMGAAELVALQKELQFVVDAKYSDALEKLDIMEAELEGTFASSLDRSAPGCGIVLTKEAVLAGGKDVTANVIGVLTKNASSPASNGASLLENSPFGVFDLEALKKRSVRLKPVLEAVNRDIGAVERLVKDSNRRYEAARKSGLSKEQLSAMKDEFQAGIDKAFNEAKRVQNDYSTQLMKDIDRAIAAEANARHLVLVFNRDSVYRGGVDLTDAVLARFDRKDFSADEPLSEPMSSRFAKVDIALLKQRLAKSISGDSLDLKIIDEAKRQQKNKALDLVVLKSAVAIGGIDLTDEVYDRLNGK